MWASHGKSCAMSQHPRAAPSLPYPGTPLSVFIFFHNSPLPRLFSVPFIHQILKWGSYWGGASRCNGRSIFLTARESEAACQMVGFKQRQLLSW